MVQLCWKTLCFGALRFFRASLLHRRCLRFFEKMSRGFFQLLTGIFIFYLRSRISFVDFRLRRNRTAGRLAYYETQHTIWMLGALVLRMPELLRPDVADLCRSFGSGLHDCARRNIVPRDYP